MAVAGLCAHAAIDDRRGLRIERFGAWQRGGGRTRRRRCRPARHRRRKPDGRRRRASVRRHAIGCPHGFGAESRRCRCVHVWRHDVRSGSTLRASVLWRSRAHLPDALARSGHLPEQSGQCLVLPGHWAPWLPAAALHAIGAVLRRRKPMCQRVRLRERVVRYVSTCEWSRRHVSVRVTPWRAPRNVAALSYLRLALEAERGQGVLCMICVHFPASKRRRSSHGGCRALAALCAILDLTACGETPSSSPIIDASTDVAPFEDTGGVGHGGCAATCGLGLHCCGGRCVNTGNDPENCGACGVACGGNTPFCQGSCTTAPCMQDAAACAGGGCCGFQCCSPGQICCAFGGGAGPAPPDVNTCYTPTPAHPTCPPGCPVCT